MARKQWWAGIGVVVLSLAGVSCAGRQHPAVSGLTAEGQAAVAGRQLVATVDAAASGADVLVTTGVLTREQGVAVLTVLRTVGVETERLAGALDVVRSTRVGTADRTAAMDRVAVILKGIQAALVQGVIPAGSEAVRARIAALLGPISDALIDLSLVIHQGQVPDLLWDPHVMERLDFLVWQREVY